MKILAYLEGELTKELRYAIECGKGSLDTIDFKSILGDADFSNRAR